MVILYYYEVWDWKIPSKAWNKIEQIQKHSMTYYLQLNATSLTHCFQLKLDVFFVVYSHDFLFNLQHKSLKLNKDGLHVIAYCMNVNVATTCWEDVGWEMSNLGLTSRKQNEIIKSVIPIETIWTYCRIRYNVFNVHRNSDHMGLLSQERQSM